MKKNTKNSIEEIVEVVKSLKATADISQDNGENTSAIKTIEVSVRKIEKMKKEVVVLKEKLRNKKADLNQEKEIMWELVRTEKKLLKNKLEKQSKSEKKQKKQKSEVTK